MLFLVFWRQIKRTCVIKCIENENDIFEIFICLLPPHLRTANPISMEQVVQHELVLTGYMAFKNVLKNGRS